MNVWARTYLLLALCLTTAPRAWAAGNEVQTFTSAEKVYLDADYRNADIYFSDFIQRFPNSLHVPEAVLYQAQARLKLGNYNGALSLLAARRSQAGTLADWYLLCQGEALLAKGDFAQAETNLTTLLRDFPTSTHRLSAAVNAAVADMRLSKWARAVELLGQTNGVFQLTASTNHANPDVIRGFLLLGEAQLAQNDTHSAEQSLQSLAASPLDATNNWQRQFLLCRVLQAEGRMDEALQGATNLVVLADATGQRSFQVETAAFQAGLLERMGRLEEALAVYQKNLSAGVSPDRQRQALLKSTELSLALGKSGQAAQVLQSFLAQFPTNDCADVALLTLGELRMRQYDPASFTNPIPLLATNVPGPTNLLDEATVAFQGFHSRFPRSAMAGKAQLDLGWCYWLSGKIDLSRDAFQSAVSLLPVSADQAQAFFKLADAQFRLTNYVAAISNYNAVVDRFPNVPEVQTNLSEPALYQIVRASQISGDDMDETNALARIMTRFPNGSYTERAVLLAGQHLGQRFPARARELFCEVALSATNSPLLPEIQLAIARTYEQQSKWDDAVRQYDSWLEVYTNDPGRGRAEYFRARSNYEAGRETNALVQFTNMVARFPSSEFAPLAQMWVADYYFGLNPQEAEINYRLVFQKWPASKLAYNARMMAGRAAVVRQDWEHAAEYFLSLHNDVTCPTSLRAQALFAYGDTFLSRNGTNKLADYRDAFQTFDLICKTYPTNRIAPLAWGQKAICLLQFAPSSGDYASATNSFQQVLDSPLADATARSIAEVGLALTLEKLADTKRDPEKTDLLEAARQHYHRVFYNIDFLRDGEQPDSFWTRKAGMEEARLAADRLQMREHAIRVYERLQEMFPAMRLDDRIKNLQAQR